MTTKEIQKRLDLINSLARDPEAAHCEEDGLYYEFIVGLSNENTDLGRKAKLVLETRKIKFPRWCA